MRNFNKEVVVALKGNQNAEIKLLNDFCKKHGFDMKKAAESYRNYQDRLVVFEREA